MAHSDFWSEGRILIAGDSRVRRLMSDPDPILAEKVDYAFEGGVLIKDLVSLVEDNLTDHHKVIILFGMIGDEVQKYLHYVSVHDTVSMIRSKECDASESIITVVKACSAKWISLRSERIVLWTIPHYIDYVSHNEGKLGDYELGKEQSSVYSRLSQPHLDNDDDDSIAEESWGRYSNLSWKASTSGENQSVPKVSPPGFIQRSQPWSWAQHNQRLNAVKVEVYTQGLESQKRAEGRLADIIRDRGLKLAEQGQFDSVNAASRCWLTNLHTEMNSPAPGAKMVQKEIAQLLPVEEDKTSSDSD
ncbi:unnamed protein product [Rotaria socialis]|uniref:Uncharacterized protein n=1 Tax=Rotaria socialis TaxID=392032 RepID=A0A821VXG0_9BILA|nr:unnamed protein product [Rotaria socialis]CAF4913381.1 unnamed protein product [Rotaria socialis]